jgi:hypothetical protein
MMNHDPSPRETDPERSPASTTSEPTIAEGSFAAATAAPSPPTLTPDKAFSMPTPRRERKPKARLLTRKKCRRIVAAAMLAPMIGLSVGLLASPAASAAQPASSAHAGPPGAAGGGSNARSGPAAGGSSGTVTSVSNSGFTMTTSAGQKVTVDESSSTKYKKGSNSLSASAIKKGTHVLVIGTVSSTTIKTTQVIVQTGNGSEPATAATVIPFQKGSPTTSKQVGAIPTSYTEGSGTIQSGATATKATEAALAAYPGGVVDRVVKLSNGEYEVHTIGVNWPHHIFVNQDFKVVGAE